MSTYEDAVARYTAWWERIGFDAREREAMLAGFFAGWHSGAAQERAGGSAEAAAPSGGAERHKTAPRPSQTGSGAAAR